MTPRHCWAGRIDTADQDYWVNFYEDAYDWKPKTFTYIIACEGTGLVKIGKSKTPEWRLNILQVGCPNRLRMVWCWPEDIEDELHNWFSDVRVRGEWFGIADDDAIEVAAKISKAKAVRELFGRETLSDAELVACHSS